MVQGADDRARILCVDDEANQLLLRQRLLERAGYEVIVADSYRAGLTAFESHPVDLAILDYWMSGGNGVQLAGALKERAKNLPIVILSAFSELPGETLGIADAWITKGVASGALLATIAKLLAKSRRSDGASQSSGTEGQRLTP